MITSPKKSQRHLPGPYPTRFVPPSPRTLLMTAENTLIAWIRIVSCLGYPVEDVIHIPDVPSRFIELDGSPASASNNYGLPPGHLDAHESLQPTSLQLSMPHPRWIDAVPWPSMRDRLILFQGLIDPEELGQDLDREGSFLVWGEDPTDEQSWEIGEDFAAKYWFLIDGMLA
jgi:hypothetical protein